MALSKAQLINYHKDAEGALKNLKELMLSQVSLIANM